MTAARLQAAKRAELVPHSGDGIAIRSLSGDAPRVPRAVQRGIDMFDCGLPTRSGRTAQPLTRCGMVHLRNARHADGPRPLDGESTCPAARDHSRAYLHHLVRSGEILGAMLLTWNNLWYYQDLMRGLRAAIAEHGLAGFAAAFHEQQAQGDLPPPG